MVISSNWMALKSKGLGDETANPRKRVLDNTLGVSQASKKQITQKHAHLLALDCEMVEGESVEHMLARVSLVDFDGRVVYDAYVRPREPVKDYRTSITGITEDILRRKGEKFDKVYQRVVSLLRDKVIVGHAVHHDFEALGLPLPGRDMLRDTCIFPPLRPPNRKQTPSLRLLAEYWLDKSVQTGSHSSVEDARTTMMFYKRFADQWESTITE
jgi:RNA exonuclease 4